MEDVAPSGADDAADWQQYIKHLSDEILKMWGKKIKMAINLVMASARSPLSLEATHVNTTLLQQSKAGGKLMLVQPVFNWLQKGLAKCRCSPFGRLEILEIAASGSSAEGLTGLHDGENFKVPSDSDTMYELGPVHWVTTPREQLAQPVPRTDEELPKTEIGLSPMSVHKSTPLRLLIAETANPGFVMVLQEKLDTCTHAEHLPFASQDVQRLMDNTLQVTLPHIDHKNAGPSAAVIFPESREPLLKFLVLEHDNVTCLHVPGWWPSDEFFKRPRKNTWPSKAMRDDIRRFGVHLVPVGAKGSPREHLEWRVSSSMAELMISTELTDTQVNSLILFKTCKQSMGQDGKSVKSYFAKTALFWLCQDTPPDAWSGAVEGAERIIKFMEKSIEDHNLQAFCCAEINLLKMTSTEEREAMLRTLRSMRENLVELLLRNTLLVAYFSRLLMGRLQNTVLIPISSDGHVSERHFRIQCVRMQIVDGVCNSYQDPSKVFSSRDRRLTALLRCTSPSNVLSIIPEERTWNSQQMAMLTAYLVAPEDIQVQVRLSSKDGLFVWDAAPLMALLTEDDLQEMLGDPDAVRAWLRRHPQWPPGAPADLRSPRDLCDLLLNIPLLNRALKETGFEPPEKDSDDHTIQTGLRPFDDMRNEFRPLAPTLLAHEVFLHFLSRGIGESHAVNASRSFLVDLVNHIDNPATRAEYNRLRTVLPDPWGIGRFVDRRFCRE